MCIRDRVWGVRGLDGFRNRQCSLIGEVDMMIVMLFVLIRLRHVRLISKCMLRHWKNRKTCLSSLRKLCIDLFSFSFRFPFKHVFLLKTAFYWYCVTVLRLAAIEWSKRFLNVVSKIRLLAKKNPLSKKWCYQNPLTRTSITFCCALHRESESFIQELQCVSCLLYTSRCV